MVLHLVEQRYCQKNSNTIFGHISGMKGLLFNPLKLYFYFDVFSVFFIHCSPSVHTHFSFPFPCVGNEKVSRNSKAGSEKTVRYLRFLSSRSRNFRNVTKNYSFLCSSISCAAASYPRGSAQSACDLPACPDLFH